MSLNEQQQKAFELIKKGENVFLTGEAGTGKSYLINKVIEHYIKTSNKNIIICAPTGLAALNIKGSTIHSVFNLPVNVPYFLIKREPNDLLKNCNVLIIDEISMCRMDLFDSIGYTLLKTKIQLIVVGDFFQLPPVLLEEEKKKLDEFYKCDVGHAFAFQSIYWEKFNFKNIFLTEIMRQKNDLFFIKLLNNLRIGNSDVLPYLLGKCSKNRIEDAVNIVGTNNRAEKINELELNKIKNPEIIVNAEINGEIKEKDLPVLLKLKFKLGAKIMFVVNTSEFVNGEIGEIIEYDHEKNILKIKKSNDRIITIEPFEFKFKEYKLLNENIEENIIGRVFQFPIKLAYAITVHKSQGQTFEKVNFEPCGWIHGQFYVAVSRVKKIENLYIDSNLLRKNMLICDSKVKNN